MLATLIVIFGAAQYALCVQAIRDLSRRPRVRGGNKVLWALGILCVPIAGAIVYNWMGPTSFAHRPVTPDSRPQILDEDDSWRNVTSITAARSARRQGAPTATQATRPHPPLRPGSRPRRTGS